MRTRSARRARVVAGIIQSLEPRRLLAVFGGTDGADAINISRSGSTTHVRINGTDHATSDGVVVVDAFGGDDVITVSGIPSGKDVTVNAGEGNDALSNTLTDIDGCYLGDFTYNGGGGTDFLRADNATDSTTPDDVLIQGESIVTRASIHLNYATIENLLYVDTLGSNRIGFINLRGPQTDIATCTINANAGDDFITNTSTNTSHGFWPTSIGSIGLTVNGGGGSDVLAIDNSSSGGGTYTVTLTTLSINTFPSGAGVLTYGGCERFELVGADGRDVMVLRGKPSATTLLVESGEGDDEFQVGDGDLDSNGFVVTNTSLLGGLGNDEIKVDDHLDNESAVESDTYNIDFFTFAKGAAGFTYGGFDVQSLEAADRISGSILIGNTINLNAVNGAMASTTINGGTLRDNTVNVGNGNLTNVSGALVFNFNTAGGAVVVNDQNATTSKTWQLTDAQLIQPRPINWSGSLFGVTLNAGTGNDTMAIESVRGNCPVAAHGGLGNDLIVVGNGSFAGLLSNLAISGDAGTDAARFVNQLDTAFTNATLTNITYAVAGRMHAFDTIENLLLGFNDPGSNLSIQSIGVTTTVNGAAGNDTVSIGNGNFSANITANIAVNGGAGGDAILINDAADTGNDSYNFNSGDVFRKGITTPAASRR